MTQSTTTPSQNGSQQQRNYFDLHTRGVGYLNRVRMVAPKKGDAFLAVDISALRGHVDAVEYTRFDARVSGSKAIDAIHALWDQILVKDNKVLVGFKVGDLYAEPFTYSSGEKKGQTGISLKVHLLIISWAKVNGRPFPLPGMETATDADDAQPEAAPMTGDLVPREKSGPVGASGHLRHAYAKDDRAHY